MPYAERLARKYATSIERAQEMIDSMVGAAASEGLVFDFDRIRPGNTFDAHRLMRLAGTRGLADATKERPARRLHGRGRSDRRERRAREARCLRGSRRRGDDRHARKHSLLGRRARGRGARPCARDRRRPLLSFSPGATRSRGRSLRKCCCRRCSRRGTSSTRIRRRRALPAAPHPAATEAGVATTRCPGSALCASFAGSASRRRPRTPWRSRCSRAAGADRSPLRATQRPTNKRNESASIFTVGWRSMKPDTEPALHIMNTIAMTTAAIMIGT